MESFTFNGVNSDDLGLIIKEMPPISRAARNIESIKVNGRNGNLHIDNGDYNSINMTIECIISDYLNYDAIKSTLQGTGELQLSTVPGRTFKATISNQIDFTKYLKLLKEFPLQLEVDPLSYGVSITDSYSSDVTFEVDGNVETYPTLTIYGTGTIYINNTAIEVLTSGITIDCELMECIKDDLNMNAYVVLDEFPKLIPGENSLSLGTGISMVTISYKERWL